MSGKTENRMDAAYRATSARRKMPRVGNRERANDDGKGGDGPKREKKKRSQKDIIRSRIGRRSCTLRDRTQNDVGVPPGTEMTHHRQSKCAYGCAQTAAVVMVIEGKAETMMKRRKMNEFSIALNSTILAKLGPV